MQPKPIQARKQSQQHMLQELMFEYFKDTDNKTLVAFIDSFVYHQPITDRKSNISKLIEKFLKDNGLEIAYTNYLIDYVRKEEAIWLKSSGSQREMIDGLKQALLNLAFNRFRNIDSTLLDSSGPAKKLFKEKKKRKVDKIKILGTSEIEKSVHIVSNINSDYAICSILLDGSMAGDAEPTDDKVDCKHCLSIVKSLQNIEL